TVYKLILDEVNASEIESGEAKQKRKQYDSITELLLNLDADTCRRLVVGDDAVIPNLSLLDPACGSGAFLVAAMKTLINVYAAILGKIEFMGDKKLNEWKRKIQENHPGINYYIKKQIITNNLYGVDLMEEATEIAKLRLFLALVASAETVEQLEPLPNIDFNIMSGNSLIGLMRVDEKAFNKHQGGDLFKKSYKELVNEKEAAVRAFKSIENSEENMEMKKQRIDRMEEDANATLNLMMGQEFNSLGIKYEQATWDEKKNKEGKAVKRNITVKDIEALEPFHWGYEFSEIFRKKDGFDAIITNPPWEIFKPQDKEFFAPYSTSIKKNTQSIKEFEKEKIELLKGKGIKKLYLEYLSNYSHQSQYFRSSPQFKNQISIVNGKKAGSDINLYKLFVEQCYNLLKKKGYCGIVIPSGIYTDLGTKQLRELLLNESELMNLISLSNERNLFEGVMHNFKFCLLTYKKDKPKDFFKGSFRIYVHESIGPEQLDSFLESDAFKLKIPIKVVREFAPDSLSIMEFKEIIDLEIVKKLINFPMLGARLQSPWNFRLSSEFHMTNDSNLFHAKPSKGTLVLYEGKMIHQFTHRFSEPQYWVNEKESRKAVLKRGEVDKGQKLEYQDYRLGTRAIGGSANERGLIATILPRNIFCGNSILISTGKEIDKPVDNPNKLLLLSFLNSYPVDYCIRQMVATNINIFYIYQLHIPRLTSKDEWYKAIVERSAKLICTTEEYADLWQEVMGNKWSEKKAATKEEDVNKLRAELDGIIAHIYGLTEEEFAYILSTFPVVPQPQKVAAQNAYRDVAKGLIKPNHH
ncbi:MAG: Eco57I restriction-modification methylase domain-containing protein, partial [Niastella sp.]|nr:Eco57I restriction-modification methylase domain-containing protein [Niastella sp.]